MILLTYISAMDTYMVDTYGIVKIAQPIPKGHIRVNLEHGQLPGAGAITTGLLGNRCWINRCPQNAHGCL